MRGGDIIVVCVKKTDADITGESFTTGLHLAQGREIKVLLCIIREALACCLVGRTLCASSASGTECTSPHGASAARRGAARHERDGYGMWVSWENTANLPLYKLLGANSDTIPVTQRRPLQRRRNARRRDEALSGAVSRRKNARGARAIKRDTERAEPCRKTIGDDIDLMIDAGEGWDVPTARCAQ
jgi:hypothetical protein